MPEWLQYCAGFLVILLAIYIYKLERRIELMELEMHAHGIVGRWFKGPFRD
jgi:hypothetical protein